jgi:hypothetical protein
MKMSPPIPKEHGAWAMLYAPLLVVVFVLGRFELSLLLFWVTVTAAFLGHEPLAILARLHPSQTRSAEKIRQARLWLFIYSALAAPALALLLFYYGRWHLLTIGALLLALLSLHLFLTAKRVERKFAGEFLGVLSLTITAPAAYYVACGQFDKTSLLLWALNLLYFTSAIFYIKMRVSRYAKKKEANLLTWQCALYHAALLVCITSAAWFGWLSLFVAFAFAPITLRAFFAMMMEEKRLSLKRIGFAEIGYTLMFITFLALGLKDSLALG